MKRENSDEALKNAKKGSQTRDAHMESVGGGGKLNIWKGMF